jgi:hypothetical protein
MVAPSWWLDTGAARGQELESFTDGQKFTNSSATLRASSDAVADPFRGLNALRVKADLCLTRPFRATLLMRHGIDIDLMLSHNQRLT